MAMSVHLLVLSHMRANIKILDTAYNEHLLFTHQFNESFYRSKSRIESCYPRVDTSLNLREQSAELRLIPSDLETDKQTESWPDERREESHHIR